MNGPFLSSCSSEIQDAANILANHITSDVRDTVDLVRPRCRRYSGNLNFRARVDTFYNHTPKWIETNNPSATPIEFAEAGFYYTGFQDLVQCYICDYCIGGWSRNIITPWEAHCAWSPNCPLVCIHQPHYFIDIQRSRAAQFYDKFHFATFSDPINNEELTDAQHKVFPVWNPDRPPFGRD